MTKTGDRLRRRAADSKRKKDQEMYARCFAAVYQRELERRLTAVLADGGQAVAAAWDQAHAEVFG
jgi:hypothetical protein